MNQQYWIYIDESGRQHQVGMLHGPDSGHLLIHCNSNIVVIDFEVNQAKSYSIFIEDQLCKIHLEKNSDVFSYKFEVDKDADIPVNRRRKKIERKHLLQTLVAFVGFALITGVVAYCMMTFNKKIETPQFVASSVLISAKVINLEKQSKNETAEIKILNQNYFAAEIFSPREISYLNHLPLKEGDELPVVLQNGIAQYSQVLEEDNLLQTFKTRTLTDLDKRYPKLGAVRISCIIERCMEEKPVYNLADLRRMVLDSSESNTHKTWNPEVFIYWSSACSGPSTQDSTDLNIKPN